MIENPYYPCCSHCDAGVGSDFCGGHTVPCCGLMEDEDDE